MTDAKKKVEAVLFSAGKMISVEEISALCKLNMDDAKLALAELKEDYKNRDSSLILIGEGDSWKLTIKEPFLQIAQKIVTETELTKTVMETLAVIAFKYPVKQADLIKIRTNKAYDHLNELEELGYITRQKYGRTRLIKLTDRFFSYFDLPPEKIKEQFKDFEGLAKAIESKEDDIEKAKDEQRKKAEEAKKKDEEERKKPKEGIEIDLEDDEGRLEKLEEYDAEEKPGQEAEVYDAVEDTKKSGEEKPSEPEKEPEKTEEEIPAEETMAGEEKPKEREFKGKGITLTEERDKIAEERAEQILHPKKESKESEEELGETQDEEGKEEGSEEEQETEEEPKESEEKEAKEESEEASEEETKEESETEEQEELSDEEEEKEEE